MQNVAYPMQYAAYPVQFSVDYPDRPFDRLTTFFRIFMAIPIIIVLGLVAGGTRRAGVQDCLQREVGQRKLV